MNNTIDNLVLGLDRALRTLTNQYSTERESPAAAVEDAEMTAAEKAHAAGLMRVNHCGEICAQALYEGQALTARSDEARSTLLHAAQEERDHLGWCRDRLTELDARPSALDPLFYSASFALGAITGLAGDKISLGFVEATEDQVVKHIDSHLAALPGQDQRSRQILEQMRDDEHAHGTHAIERGGEVFPAPVKRVMTLLSQVMTRSTYRV